MIADTTKKYVSILTIGYFLVLFLTWITPTGLTPAVDEACFVGWAITGKSIEVWTDFLGPKVFPALLVQSMVSFLGHGMTSFYLMKLVFSLFGLAILLGVFAWRKTEGDSDHRSLLISLIVLSTPLFMNGAGRILSELPAVAFLIWGIVAVVSARKTEKGIIEQAYLSGLALILFCLAISSRSTIFSAAGSYLGYEILRFLLNAFFPDNNQSRSSLKVIFQKLISLPAVWVSCALAGTLILWPMLYDLPMLPWNLVGIAISGYIQPPEAGVASFFFGLGVWKFTAISFPLLALIWGKFKVKDLAEIAWLIAAILPFATIIYLGAGIIARHVADVILPVALITVIFGERLVGITKISLPRIIASIILILVLLAGWRFAHGLSHSWSHWVTHQVLSGRRFFYWLVAAVSFSAVIIWQCHSIRKKQFRLIQILPVLVVLITIHQYISMSGIRWDSCLFSPPMLRAALQEADVKETDVIAVPVVGYEAAILEFTLPDWNLMPLDHQYSYRPVGIHQDDPPRWAVIAHHNIVENPELLNQMNELSGTDSEPKISSQWGQMTLYELDPENDLSPYFNF